jgi:hypothetical protein
MIHHERTICLLRKCIPVRIQRSIRRPGMHCFPFFSLELGCLDSFFMSAPVRRASSWVWSSSTASGNGAGACFCTPLPPSSPRLGGITAVLVHCSTGRHFKNALISHKNFVQTLCRQLACQSQLALGSERIKKIYSVNCLVRWIIGTIGKVGEKWYLMIIMILAPVTFPTPGYHDQWYFQKAPWKSWFW